MECASRPRVERRWKTEEETGRRRGRPTPHGRGKGLAQVFDAGGFRKERPAVAWRETEWNCRCALRMRLQACSGAERQNGMEQMGKQVYGRHEARMTSIFLLWEREVAE